MSVEVLSRSNDEIILNIRIPLKRSLLETEESILDALNDAGTLSTREALMHFDADGSPITIAGTKYTSKGKLPKAYQTPYGETSVPRHVYQGSSGGRTYCPSH